MFLMFKQREFGGFLCWRLHADMSLPASPENEKGLGLYQSETKIFQLCENYYLNVSFMIRAAALTSL